MPTYDYECQKCGTVFEVFQSMKDAKLTECREEGCDGQVKRLLGTGGGIIFKGSGFYETDYRSKSYQAGAKADQEAGKKETKSESKSSGKKSEAAKKAG